MHVVKQTISKVDLNCKTTDSKSQYYGNTPFIGKKNAFLYLSTKTTVGFSSQYLSTMLSFFILSRMFLSYGCKWSHIIFERKLEELNLNTKWSIPR